jgi:hypothetical protein
MHCKQLESALEAEGLGPLPVEAQQHLAGCQSCQDMLADFSTIAITAKSIPAEVQPPDRIWISVRAQLEAEGVIHEPREVLEHPSHSQEHSQGFWQNLSALLRPRNLATVGVGLLLAVGAFLQTRKNSPSVGGLNEIPTTNVATGTSLPPGDGLVPPVNATKVSLPSPSEAGVTLQQAEQDLPNIQLAGNSTVDASLRQNLRTVDEFIAECERHLKVNPQDELAREYLYSAYQQKAELLAAMMDSGRSEH